MSPAPIPSMTAEEDFEFVPSQSHDHDDLSSITSNAGETDNESDAGALESQAGSNITLRMPQVAESHEQMTQADNAARKLHSEITRSCLPEATAEFDLKSNERVELPILYLGAEEHKKNILSKVASALLPEFTSDVWTSTTYSIQPSGENDSAEVFQQSRLSFRVVTDSKQLASSDQPFLIIHVDSSDTNLHGVDNPPLNGHTGKVVKIGSVFSNVPHLLLDATLQKACDATRSVEYGHTTSDLLCIIDSTVMGSARNRPLTVDEFFKLDEEANRYLTNGLVSALDLWHESKNSVELVREPRSTTDLALMYKLLPWLLLLISLVMHFSAFASTPLSRATGPGNLSSSSITFHQITETNALIEVPVIYRTQPVEKLPKMTAVVTRDGKRIHSRLQLVVDNLYSLDWAQTEAHGELVVTAQMAAQKKTLEDAYIIQYSAKTPFLLSLIEKMHELQNLGHLPEVDFSRRVNELVRQVEDSRSYAVNVSQNQLRYIRESSSEGLKRLSKGYPGVLQASGDSIKDILAKSSAMGAQIGEQSLKQIANAEAGFEKLKRMMRKHKPLVQKHSRPAKWAHQLRKSFQSRKN